jgi:hypothetical protein
MKRAELAFDFVVALVIALVMVVPWLLMGLFAGCLLMVRKCVNR